MNSVQVVLRGKQTENAAKGAQDALYIWDRIINLRLNRADGKSGVVIRSDYEAVMKKNADGTDRIHFVRMQQKPQIKIRYNQVTDGTATKIVVEVTNLYMYLAGAMKTNDLSQDTNPFVTITIEMGYFSNFDDFSDTEQRITDAGTGAKDLIDKLAKEYNVVNTNRRWVRTIDARILSMYQSKPAPNAVTTINCIVGDISSVFHANPDRKTKDVVAGKNETLKDLFFKTITRRYVRRSDYSAYITKTDANGGVLSRKDADGKALSISCSGTIPESDALSYGVLVYCTDTIANVKLREGTLFYPMADTAEQTMREIQRSVYANLSFVQDVRGNYIAFDREKDSLAVVRESYFGKGKPTTIPAVYNVSLGALRMVSCPFFGFVNPFSLVQFNARYSTSNLVGTFYKPEPGNDTFMAIKCVISFSTCDDDNEMLLTSVDEEAQGAGV